jgi:uncharacterized hydrophobic protein (TIGR00271 family)
MAEQSKGTKEMEEVRHGIIAGATLSAPYLIMNTLATIVACYGLLSNSTAVVIGAMIIAMLLGPIMGLALAMVDGDLQLLRTAVIAETIGALMVVAIGMILGKIHSGIYLTPEILVRTRPNLLDLFIALAGGAAGAYATVSPRVAIGLVGVAISTDRGLMVPVIRDADKDMEYDENKIQEGIFGINIHKAGADSTYVENWSEGCQVFKKAADFESFMVICRKAAAVHGKSFTYTLIESKDLV